MHRSHTEEKNMIFGHTVDFCDEPSLNFSSFSSSPILYVRLMSLPVFENVTHYMPHSLQQVRYGFHESMKTTKGKQVEWMMEIKDVLKLVWFPSLQTIGYEKLEGYRADRLQFWVYHTFMPLLLQMEEIYHILHVGSVEVNGKAVIFMAPSFGGKSTLTDYFLKQGHRLLSDDTLAIEETISGKFQAVASWPFYRPYREPEVLGEVTDAFVKKPLKIAAVFCLEKSAPQNDVRIHTMQGIEKFKAVHFGTFIQLDFLKERAFTFHTHFAQTVTMYRLEVPWEKKRLKDIYDTIIKKIES